MTHYIKKINEEKLAFIILYTKQNVYFTGNPNYTLFGFPISHDRDLKVCEYEYMIDNFSLPQKKEEYIVGIAYF